MTTPVRTPAAFRRRIDCRALHDADGCTLTISGAAEEVLPVAAQHAVAAHAHTEDVADLVGLLRPTLADDVPAAPGAFVQLVEFSTDRPEEWEPIVSRWATAIGAGRTARWAVACADRDASGRHLAIVEFPDHAAAMANSAHPATSVFLSELSSICSEPPTFRNLDVRSACAF